MSNEQRKRDLIQKQASKAGFRGKINAMCISCIYDTESPGNWRQQTGHCTVKSCPLWSVRPESSEAA